MDKYVNQVSQILSNLLHTDIDKTVVQDYIKNWQTNKQHFIDAFNGTIYTYSTPIECEMDDEHKQIAIDNFIDALPATIKSLDNLTFGFSTLCDFIRLQGLNATKNIVSTAFECPDGTKIPVGMKLLRAFKYFIKDKDILTDVQDKMNLIISQCKLTGYLHLSVDPLDYLSVSENSFGWRSCHSLDGDYAAGNIDYMMDKATVVCYLDDGTTDHTIHNFPADIHWNDKKWRMLLFISPDYCTIAAGRQYPTSASNIMPYVRYCITKIFSTIRYSDEWTNLEFKHANWKTNQQKIDIAEKHIIVPIDGCVYPMRSLYGETASHTHLFYDDILTSTIYTKPYFLYGRPKGFIKDTQFSRTLFPILTGYEHQVMCPCCGQHPLQRGEGFDCENNESDEYYYCECCGRRHLTGDEGGWVDEQWWCNDCIADNAAICSRCGELHNIEDMYYNEEEGYTCRDCMEE